MNMSILRPKQYAKRANIDCVELVKLVKIHPGLWDNRNPSRHNRISLTENWIEVANALNQTEEVCRKKWKYLKDQYRKELRTELRSGPKFKSTWNVYEHMSFMKPYFKALLMANEEYKRVSNDEDCEEITESDGDFDEDDFDEEASEKSSLDSNTVDIRGLEDYMNKVNSAPPFQESQNKKVRLDNENHNDGSLEFFRSLLPFMQRLSSIQKLRVRNTIQNVILHELEVNGDDNFDDYHVVL